MLSTEDIMKLALPRGSVMSVLEVTCIIFLNLHEYHTVMKVDSLEISGLLYGILKLLACMHSRIT